MRVTSPKAFIGPISQSVSLAELSSVNYKERENRFIRFKCERALSMDLSYKHECDALPD
jgi:hypothetical protein